MKRKYIIIGSFILILLGIIIFFAINGNSNNSGINNSNYNANKTEAIIDNTQNDENDANNTNNSEENTNPKVENKTVARHDETPPPPVETEISSFSTPIVSDDDSRQNNVELTCEKLNDTIVENGATFSFCDTLGPATTEDGFQKAEIFDSKGNKIMGLGGGKCQVSSTLYNAILAVPSLEVTERHEHSNKVPYIESGKDAAVYYGNADLKFVNNSGKTIKIKASTDGESVTTSIVQLN
ncbi:MAG: VanW family protein [Clostridia bacterium]|nr:VanW family protein [Clostridia bacterium]